LLSLSQVLGTVDSYFRINYSHSHEFQLLMVRGIFDTNFRKCKTFSQKKEKIRKIVLDIMDIVFEINIFLENL